MLDCSHLPLCRRIPGGLDLFMRSLEVRLANELLRLAVAGSYKFRVKHVKCLFVFPPDKDTTWSQFFRLQWMFQFS